MSASCRHAFDDYAMPPAVVRRCYADADTLIAISDASCFSLRRHEGRCITPPLYYAAMPADCRFSLPLPPLSLFAAIDA